MNLIFEITLVLALASAPSSSLSFQVLPNSKPSEVWLRPYVAPATSWRLLHGKLPQSAIEGCVQHKDEHVHADHSDTVIVLSCSHEVQLVLQNVDFDN